MSPIRLTIIAFKAALFAWRRPYQKLTNKYEHNPTPSHPKKSWKKLSAVTNNNIKKVNNDKYDIKRWMCGSCDIYSVEYKWTHIEIDVTTTNITTVKLSKRKPHEKVNKSDSNQLNVSI